MGIPFSRKRLPVYWNYLALSFA